MVVQCCCCGGGKEEIGLNITAENPEDAQRTQRICCIPGFLFEEVYQGIITDRFLFISEKIKEDCFVAQRLAITLVVYEVRFRPGNARRPLRKTLRPLRLKKNQFTLYPRKVPVPELVDIPVLMVSLITSSWLSLTVTHFDNSVPAEISGPNTS